MIIQNNHLCTRIPIWSPKYATEGECWEVWISKSKVAYASPIVIVEFTKAKHLIGQRFAIRRQDIERSPLGSNGKIPVYRVPFDKLETWETGYEVRDYAFSLFKDEGVL